MERGGIRSPGDPGASSLAGAAMSGLVLLLLLAAGGGCRTPQVEPLPPREPPPLTTVGPREPQEFFIYQVRRGDTLSSLGARFRVPWRTIAEDNDIRDPNQLTVDQILFIRRVEGVEVPEPGGSEAAPDAPAARRPVPQAALHRDEPGSSLWWPTSGTLLRRYGEAVRGLAEPGIAIAAPSGTEVYAVASGEVITCIRTAEGSSSGWGNVVAVAHSDGKVSWYGHLDSILVQAGDRVRKGEPIGTVGATGAADRPQLAFRLFEDERFIDPQRHLP